jgi:hypothetical protein
MVEHDGAMDSGFANTLDKYWPEWHDLQRYPIRVEQGVN